MEIGNTGERFLRSDGWRYVQELNFDIFVGVEEKQGNSGKDELKVAILRLSKNIYIIHSYQFLLIIRWLNPGSCITRSISDSMIS